MGLSSLAKGSDIKEVSCMTTSLRNGWIDKNLNNENISRYTNMEGRKFSQSPTHRQKSVGN